MPSTAEWPPPRMPNVSLGFGDVVCGTKVEGRRYCIGSLEQPAPHHFRVAAMASCLVTDKKIKSDHCYWD